MSNRNSLGSSRIGSLRRLLRCADGGAADEGGVGVGADPTDGPGGGCRGRSCHRRGLPEPRSDGVVNRLARALPGSIAAGLQLGLGLSLAALGIRLIET